MNLKISALEYVQEVQNGNISSEDFVAKTLEQINKVDEKLHAFLSVNNDAINQARIIDKKIKSGRKLAHVLECPYQLKITCVSKIVKLLVAQKCLRIMLPLMMQQS